MMHLFHRHRTNDLVQAIDRCDWDRVTIECGLNPEQAKDWHEVPHFMGGTHSAHLLPLHHALATPDTPPHVIHAIIRANPSAVTAKESTLKRVPLHLACQNYAPRTSGHIIRLLLAYAAEAAGERDSLGRLPLHYACANGAGVMSIDALVKTYPKSAMTRAHVDRYLPIHVACTNGASVFVVQRLLDAYPESSHLTTAAGLTPRDLVLEHEEDFHGKKEIIRLLSSEKEHSARKAYSDRYLKATRAWEGSWNQSTQPSWLSAK